MGYGINPHLKDVYSTEPDSCPYCGYMISCSKSVAKPGKPTVIGDLALCLGCGGFLTYDRNMKLKKLPFNEFDSLDAELKTILIMHHDKLRYYKKSMRKEYEMIFDLQQYLEGKL